MHRKQGQFNRIFFSDRSKVKVMTKAITFSSHFCSSVFCRKTREFAYGHVYSQEEGKYRYWSEEKPSVSTPVLFTFNPKTGLSGFILIDIWVVKRANNAVNFPLFSPLTSSYSWKFECMHLYTDRRGGGWVAEEWPYDNLTKVKPKTQIHSYGEQGK